MKFNILISIACLAASSYTGAVVIRSDVPDAGYTAGAHAFAPLVDLPSEGHGTLIAPRWVITAAHAVADMHGEKDNRYVVINGKRRAVSRVVPYPDYAASASAWKQLFARRQSSDAAIWMKQYDKVMGSLHDVALIELRDTVQDVEPAAIYRGTSESGQVVDMYGAGATGNSLTGVPDGAPHRGALRHAENRIASTHEQWSRYVLDCGTSALPLEGAMAGGDSGSPLVMTVDGKQVLVGVGHGLDGSLDDVLHTQSGTFRFDVCGQAFVVSRVSFYAQWIDDTARSISK